MAFFEATIFARNVINKTIVTICFYRSINFSHPFHRPPLNRTQGDGIYVASCLTVVGEWCIYSDYFFYFGEAGPDFRRPSSS